ncbi:MAG TPA: protein kinase [Pyrinomonadaceae bacterium]|jgi:serine/threonine protein kinase
MIEIGTLLQERYLIEKQIGVGGMGEVYLAVDQRFESYVAIKKTFYNNDELGEAFEREARLLNSLLHPVLPHVSDYFTESGGYFLVMQYIEGEDLFEILKREGSFPIKDVLRWTDSLLDALDYLHSQEPPIIHRDIKPHNLKITPRGDVILLDFGLAKLNSDNTTGVKSVFGYSRKYSPLEQIQGTGTDARSDLFALAATAYHLLTGKPPIDVLARASEIIVGNPDPLPLVSEVNKEVPLGVAHILNTALALNAAGRFVSAKAMRQALENASNEASNEEAAVLPEQILPPIAADPGIVISPENEDFPALEAFAAGAANVSAPAAENNELAENYEFIDSKAAFPQAEASLPVEPTFAQPTFAQSTVSGDVATKVTPRRRASRLPLAVLAALIICAGLAAGYFINRANSSSQSPLTASTPQESNSETGQNAVVSDSPTPEASDSPLLQNLEQAKTKPLAIEKTVAKKEIAKETVDEPISKTETAEKPKPAPVEESRPVQAPSRRNESPRRNQTSTRRTETEPVPDIESVFTGRPSSQRGERWRRQEQWRREPRDDMSEEEWREWRRQRREERRRRQNRNYFPF